MADTAIDPRTKRPLGDHGTHNQAMTWALDVSNDAGYEIEAFLRAWREGDAFDEWPDFYAWLDTPAGKAAA